MDERPPIFDQIVALPSWYFINLMYPFLPKTHMWKKFEKTPPLFIWAKWRTPVTTLFDIVFWMCGCAMLISLMGLWFRSISGV